MLNIPLFNGMNFFGLIYILWDNKNDSILFFTTFTNHLSYVGMNAQMIFLAIGPWQIAIIVMVVLLLFGGKKIPELMRGLGSGIKEFKDASKEDEKLDEKKE